MKPNTFVTQLACGAVASAIASVAAGVESQNVDAVLPDAGGVAVLPTGICVCSGAEGSDEIVSVITIPEDVREWTKQMENEFRRLALAEVQGTLDREQTLRLETLSGLRERLLNPRSTEEILLQLRRDRLLGKMAETLKEYVEFLHTAGGQGSRAS